MATSSIKIWLLRIAGVAVVGGAAFALWWFLQPQGLPAGFAGGNGRIEAVEIDIAAKAAGRVLDILADEGDFVRAGQIVAKMDTAVLEAQLREAQAQLQRARIAVETEGSLVTQREAEKQAAEALIGQRQAELDAAQRRLARSSVLAPRGAAPESRLDDDRAAFQAARAAVAAAEAQAAAAQAAISQATSNVVAAQAAVEAAQATIERIQADIDDSVLRAPRDGRVQYRVAQPGEVLSAGGAVLNMVDLSDVYMTFFLPTAEAGRVALGADARIVLDAVPQYVIPAKVSFVADVAQFTPKTVETAEERQKLMFRIKAQIDADLLKKHLRQVKTGLPGMAYVRLDPRLEWPPELQSRVPQ
jgi:HlyD family secretion protein